jgi:hypothetical protein
VEEGGGSGGDQDRRPGAEPLAAGGVKRIPQARPSEPRRGFGAAAPLYVKEKASRE